MILIVCFYPSRSTSQTSSITSSLPPMHARLHHPPSSREGSTVISPSEVEVAMTTAPYGSPHFRDGSLQRPREGSPLDSRYPPYSPYSSDSAASYPLPDSNPQVPTRGSGRRNRPERGSGRNQGGSSVSSPSSEPTSENCSTYPRSTSQSRCVCVCLCACLYRCLCACLHVCVCVCVCVCVSHVQTPCHAN